MVDILKRKAKCEIGISDIDLCVCCGVKTEYGKETPIGKRFEYIEGSGQLCPRCFHEIYGKKKPSQRHRNAY